MATSTPKRPAVSGVGRVVGEGGQRLAAKKCSAVRYFAAISRVVVEPIALQGQRLVWGNGVWQRDVAGCSPLFSAYVFGSTAADLCGVVVVMVRLCRGGVCKLIGW
jgi:hypothetical protein